MGLLLQLLIARGLLIHSRLLPRRNIKVKIRLTKLHPIAGHHVTNVQVDTSSSTLRRKSLCGVLNRGGGTTTLLMQWHRRPAWTLLKMASSHPAVSLSLEVWGWEVME
jgi:hypothetical protein